MGVREEISKASACILMVCPVQNGVEGPTRLLQFMTFVHLPLSFRSRDLSSLFQHLCVYEDHLILCYQKEL